MGVDNHIHVAAYEHRHGRTHELLFPPGAFAVRPFVDARLERFANFDRITFHSGTIIISRISHGDAISMQGGHHSDVNKKRDPRIDTINARGDDVHPAGIIRSTPDMAGAELPLDVPVYYGDTSFSEHTPPRSDQRFVTDLHPTSTHASSSMEAMFV